LNQNPEYVVGITGASGSVYGVRLVQELLKRGFNVSLIISDPGKLVLEHELGIGSPREILKNSLQANNSMEINACTNHPNLKTNEKEESQSKPNELCEFKTLIRGFEFKDGRIPNSGLASTDEVREKQGCDQGLDDNLLLKNDVAKECCDNASNTPNEYAVSGAHGRPIAQKNGTAAGGKLRYYGDDDLMAPICSGSHFTRGMIIIPCSMATLGSVANGISSSLIERTADVMLKESRELVLVPRETPLNRIHLKNMLNLQESGANIVPAMPAFYHMPQTIEDMVNFVVGKVLDVLRVEHDLFERWSG
jgi:polyprenyl P-hydroxybenzoate/phenylacrylic acid decarboxylase-like protein